MNRNTLKTFCITNLLNIKGLPDPNKLRKKWFEKNGFELEFNFIQKLYPNINNFSTIIYNIINDIDFVKACPVCNKNPVKFINFKKGYTKCCSIKCASNLSDKKEAIKTTNLQKYGVDCVFKNENVKEKIVNTNIKKYGTKNVLQKESFLYDDIKNAVFEKYGVDHISKSTSIKNKIAATNLIKYGVKCVLSNNNIRDKIKKTNTEKYGCECVLGSEEIREKSTNTCLKKYGVSSYTKTEEFKDKIRQTNLKNYGVEYPQQKHYTKELLNKLDNSDWLIEQHHILQRPIRNIAQELNVDHTTVKSYMDKYNIEIRLYNNSIGEKNLKEFLSSYLNIYFNNKQIIFPKELDIFIPEKQIAIEYNGLYWHSTLHRDNNNYHQDKYSKCKEKGIRLITLYEDEWETKKELVKKKLLHILGINSEHRIFSRKCKIQQISTKQAKQFQNEFHIQGYGNSSINIGLIHGNELVACMGFRNLGNTNYELNRYSTKYNVVGGFSKLLCYFKSVYEWNEIITFADLRWHTGDVYLKNDFKIDKILKPDYQYIINGKRIHKFNFRLKKIQKKFPDKYDETLTEIENMNKIGIPRIYDCGKIKFIIKKVTHEN